MYTLTAYNPAGVANLVLERDLDTAIALAWELSKYCRVTIQKL